MIFVRFPLLSIADISNTNRSLKRLGMALLLACLWPMLAIASTPPWSGAISAGGNGYTLARAIKAAPGGGYYVTGQFDSTAYFSGTAVVSRGGPDIFLAKYASSGKLLWIVTVGGLGDDQGWGLDLDGGGNVFLTGYFSDSGSFDSANKTHKTVQGSGYTIFLARYSPDGNLAWVQTGTSDYGGLAYGYGVAVDSAANTVYIAALSQGNTTFSSENGIVNTIAGVSTWHMVLAQYGTDGNFRWAQTNQASPNSVPYGIAVDSAGDAYVTGWLEDQTTFSSANGNDITVNGFSPAQSNGDYPDDAFLAKYDKNGNALWVNHIGGYKAIGNGVAVSPSGEVSLAGFVGNFDSPGEASTIVTSQPPRKNYILNDAFITDPFNPDVLIVTYTAAGVLERAVRIGHGGSETANGVTYDANGDLYVVGVSEQSPTIRANLFLRKYHGGTLVWEQKAGSSALWNYLGAVSCSVGRHRWDHLRGRRVPALGPLRPIDPVRRRLVQHVRRRNGTVSRQERRSRPLCATHCEPDRAAGKSDMSESRM